MIRSGIKIIYIVLNLKPVTASSKFPLTLQLNFIDYIFDNYEDFLKIILVWNTQRYCYLNMTFPSPSLGVLKRPLALY